MDVIYLSDLIDTISDSKEFSLSESDIDCMVKGLNNRVIGNMDISN